MNVVKAVIVMLGILLASCTLVNISNTSTDSSGDVSISVDKEKGVTGTLENPFSK